MILKERQPSTQKVEAEKSEVQGHLQLYTELKASLAYMKLCLKKITNRKTNQIIRQDMMAHTSILAQDQGRQKDCPWGGGQPGCSKRLSPKLRTAILEHSAAPHAKDHPAKLADDLYLRTEEQEGTRFSPEYPAVSTYYMHLYLNCTWPGRGVVCIGQRRLYLPLLGKGFLGVAFLAVGREAPTSL